MCDEFDLKSVDKNIRIRIIRTINALLIPPISQTIWKSEQIKVSYFDNYYQY